MSSHQNLNHFQRVFILGCFFIALLIETALSHGYVSVPIARAPYCNSADKCGLNWPYDGSGARDEMCGKSHRHVYDKNSSLEESGANGAAMNQLNQMHEYSLNLLDYYNSQLLRTEFPKYLCAAGRDGSIASRFDFTGMTLAGNWHKTKYTMRPGSTSSTLAIDMEYCATAPHPPAFWEFYITSKAFDPLTQVLTWNDLEMFDFRWQNVDQVAKSGFGPCTAQFSYFFHLRLPARDKPSILFSRWQRIDAGGEMFNNCSDIDSTN